MMKEGAVRCANIGRGDQPNKKVGYVDLGKGAHFGERALLRDEMRACDVISLEPTACYVVSRSDFNAMLGSMSEAMERSLALRVIMSISAVAHDADAVTVLREPEVFEQLERKIYKAGEVISSNVNSLKKIVVIASGVVEVRSGANGLGRGRKRVIQRRFNVGVLEAIPKRKASTL